MLGDVRGYAFVSSLNAYRDWPPGPIGREDGPPHLDHADDEYGPIKADAERDPRPRCSATGSSPRGPA